MTTNQANNPNTGDPVWGRARTNSAFQSVGSDTGPSVGPYFNSDKELPYSPVSGVATSTLTPIVGTFGDFNSISASQRYHDSWSPQPVGLPGADLSAYSLQSHNNTQIAHGNIDLHTYWDQRDENVRPQYHRPSFAGAQAQGLGLQLVTGELFKSEHGMIANFAGTYEQAAYVSYPRTPLPSVAEGKSAETRERQITNIRAGLVSRTMSNGSHLPRPRRTLPLPPINVDVANGRTSSPQTPYSAVSTEPDTAIYSPKSGAVNFKDPFMGGAVSTNILSPQAASPLNQVVFTPQSAIGPQTPFPSTTRAHGTPAHVRHPSRASQDKDFNQEEKDFIMYLALQGMRSEAVGLELARFTGSTGHNMNIDQKGKMMGRRVVSSLRSQAESKGTVEDADRIVGELMARADREGWSEGVLSRAKAYSSNLTRGKSIGADNKDRVYDARCRAMHKKWRMNHPVDPPRENARNKDEMMAFRGMLLEGTAHEVDGPTKEELKKNLMELWDSCTIGGKAVK